MGKHRGGHRGPVRATQRLPDWGTPVLRAIGCASAESLRALLRALYHLINIAEERLADLENGSKGQEGHEGKVARAPGGSEASAEGASASTSSWS